MEELGGADDPRRQVAASRTSWPTPRPTASPRLRALLVVLPDNNLEPVPLRARRPIPPTARMPELDTHHPRLAEPAVRHEARDRARSSTTATSSRSTPRYADEHRLRLRAARRPRRSASSATSRGRWPACSTSTPREGGALRALLRRVQHPARDVRRRARASCPAPSRSAAASSGTARSCSTPTAEATVPKLTVITRKAYGGAYDVMGSKHLRRRLQLRLADGRGRRDGPRRRRQHRLPQGAGRGGGPASRAAPSWSTTTRDRFANPYMAAERGYVDDVIAAARDAPRAVRRARGGATKRVERPQRKHGNIPL